MVTVVEMGFKHTEVGIIPEDWSLTPLINVVEYIHGKAHEQDIDENGDFIVANSKFISSSGRIKKLSTKNQCPAKKGDILTVLSDIPNGKALAKCYYVDKDNEITVNQRICIWRSKNADTKFLYYRLNRLPYFLSLNDGVNQTNIGNSDIDKCIISLPPTIEEQKSIATVLTDIDELITGLEKLISKKKNIKQGAMQQLLTPPHKGGKRLPGFHEKWEEKNLKDIIWFQEGPGVRKDQFTTRGVKLLNGTNIHYGKLDLDRTSRYVSEHEAYGWYSHFLVDDGDILIACSGITVSRFDEKVTEAEEHHLPLCMNTSTMRFKMKSKSIIKEYFMHYLKSSDFKTQIGGQATGSAQLNFGPSHVEKVIMEIPSVKEQQEIAQILSDMDAEITQLETKKEKYKAIKQGMMQELLTGKTRLV